MHIRQVLKANLAAIVLMLLASTFSIAQFNRDDGQSQILEARYGTARRNVDVTSRLKELAREDIRFRMGNSTFGVDPDPGVVKTLRIYARSRNGQNRMFEYTEGSTVDGSLFTGWGNGNWGRGGWKGGWGGHNNVRVGEREDYASRDSINATYGGGTHRREAPAPERRSV